MTNRTMRHRDGHGKQASCGGNGLTEASQVWVQDKKKKELAYTRSKQTQKKTNKLGPCIAMTGQAS